MRRRSGEWKVVEGKEQEEEEEVRWKVRWRWGER